MESRAAHGTLNGRRGQALHISLLQSNRSRMAATCVARLKSEVPDPMLSSMGSLGRTRTATAQAEKGSSDLDFAAEDGFRSRFSSRNWSSERVPLSHTRSCTSQTRVSLSTSFQS